MDRLQRGLISLLKKLHIYEKPEPIHINREEVVEAHRKKVMPFLPKVGITTLSTSYRNNGYPREAERIGNFHYCGVEHNLNDPSDFCVEDLYLPDTIGSPWSYGNTTWLIEQKSRLEAAKFASVSQSQAKVKQAQADAQANEARQKGYNACPACQQIDILKALPQGITVYAPGSSAGIAIPTPTKK
jgi:hypothetical protein